MKHFAARMLMGLCLLAGTGFIPCHAAEIIVLAGSTDSKETPQVKWAVLLYTEVFRRLGYELHYDVYPLARVTAVVDSGEVDGEIQRPAEYQAAHPNLIRVDEPHGSVKYVAYAARPGILLAGWTSLKNTAYRVEYRRGLSRAATELKAVVPPERLSEITTTEQGLQKLMLGRMDVYVDLDYNVDTVLKRMDPPSAVYEAGAMQESLVYAYLHKKRSALVPKVSETLKAMKQEGLIEQYREIVFGEKSMK